MNARTKMVRGGLQGNELAEFYKLVGRRTREDMEAFLTGIAEVQASADHAGPHLRPDGALRISGSAKEWMEQELHRTSGRR